MTEQPPTTDPTIDIPDGWVEIITADGERGYVSPGTALHMITNNRARPAATGTGEAPAPEPAAEPVSEDWADAGGTA